MAHFLLKLHGPRATFPGDASDEEREAMRLHAEYWQALIDNRTAIAVGPVFDPAGAWGMALVETENAERAERLGWDDPVILSGLGFSYSLATIPSIMLRS